MIEDYEIPKTMWDELQTICNQVNTNTEPFATHVEGKMTDAGSYSMGYDVSSALLGHIHNFLHKNNINIVFPWMDWEEGRAWFNSGDEGKYDDIDFEFIRKAFTAISRNDRFNSGAFAQLFELGVGAKLLNKMLTFRP